MSYNNTFSKDEQSGVKLFEGYSDELLMLASASCIVFMIVGIPGNMLTILALIRGKHTRNSTAIFIMNLSSSDLLFDCFNLPLAASTFLRRSWIHGELLCRFFPLMRYGLLAVSLFTVSLITINRYVIIAHPRHYSRIYQRRYLALMIVGTWLTAFSIMIPTWRGIWGKFGLDTSIGSCSILLDKNGHTPKVFFFIAAFMVPGVCIVVCYARILYLVRKAALKSREPQIKNINYQNEKPTSQRPIYENEFIANKIKAKVTTNSEETQSETKPFDVNEDIEYIDVSDSNDTGQVFDETIKLNSSNTNLKPEDHIENQQNALHGNAKRVVAALSQVIDELSFNFGRPELLIRVQMKKIQQFNVIAENRLEQIVDFSNQVRNIVAFLKSSGCQQHLHNPMLLEELVLKLPASKQFEWSRHAVSVSAYSTIETFAEWLSDVAKVASLMPSMFSAPQRGGQSQSTNVRSGMQPLSGRPSTSAPRRVLHSNESDNTQQQQSQFCVKCKQSHKLSECSEFKVLGINNRWKFVKANHLCFGCLQRGHGLSECRLRRECGLDACKRMHHSLLHQPTSSTNPPSLATSSENENDKHLLNCRDNNHGECLFKILPVVLTGPKTSVTVYAMFDEGSSITLLEEDVATDIGCKGRSTPLTLQWYNNKQITEQSRVVSLQISEPGQDASFQLKSVYTIKQLDLPKQTFDRSQYRQMRNLPIENYSAIKPTLLIGLDNSHLCVSKDQITSEPNGPIAVKTKLGWLVYGPTPLRDGVNANLFHVRKSFTNQHLHQLVEEYFSLDSLVVKNPDTPLECTEDLRARQILEATTKNIGRRYEVGLLWHEDNIKLPQSYEMAKRRLINVENKMARDPKYAETYIAEINKYINKGYAHLLTNEEAKEEGHATWYLPHFGVINCHKPNKLRIVFDAAASLSNTLLNSVLLKGPERAQPLMSIMFKFRQRTIAVAGDIQEMFSQIKIRPQDRQSQRFLWRHGDQSQPIQVYVMSSMIFGAACSPCCAEYIKNFNAIHFRENMPRGAKAIIENTYVDDLVISFDNAQDAKTIINEAISINAAAGFHLRNFVSDCKDLQYQLNRDKCTLPDVVSMEHQSTIDKVLGMYWNSRDDVLEFHFRFHKIPHEVINCKRSPTKRELLGLAMVIYDPFGLLANITVGVKLILQDTWKHQIDWDEHLSSNLAARWVSWWEAFRNIKHFPMPRCYSPIYSTANDLQLHISVDASEAAYAAVAYLRIKLAKDVRVAFVAAKSRCAPKRSTTVPRLELQAAVLGSRLRTLVEQCLDRSMSSVTFWSDSKTVLLWIRSTKRDFKQFVASRVAEILTNTDVNQWRWIPTAINIADQATKVKPSKTYTSDSRWITGPESLNNNEDTWPVESPPLHSDLSIEEECKKISLFIANNVFLVDFRKYSTITKLLRVVAWVVRFIRNSKSNRHGGELSSEELKNAENIVCRQAQYEFYKSYIATLRAKERLSKASTLFKLTPMLDTNGLLRINGRIDAAYCLPDSARRPIIIPRHHHLAILIMDHFHRKNHHQNSKLTVNEMRQRFWIPRALSLLTSVKKMCPICIRANSKPVVPLMGQLPTDRLTPCVRPFSYTGVDYCGPFFVTVGRRREKRWIALFTCLTTRAIHLEIAVDLSADAFIICLRNFVNRRGVPVRIRSDNGTNFIGAQRELKKEHQLFDFDQNQREISKHGMEWNFNCPANPSAGGCWERLVQCVKRILQRVLKEEAPRQETFCSVLIEAENIVNSRPLTDIPISPDSDEPLTPNHFLLGCVNSTQTPCESEEKICLRKQWKISQHLKDRFWKRWISEYLPQLLTRPKWHEEATPLKPGQLVIICDSNLPRSQWQTGRILEVFTAKDGQVRSANIQTSHGIIKRPSSKLAALEFVNPTEDSPGGEM